MKVFLKNLIKIQTNSQYIQKILTTIIPNPLSLNQNQKHQAKSKFLERKKKYRETTQKVKEVLVELSDEQLNEIEEEELLAIAGVSKTEYYKALEHSQVGACIVLKRKPMKSTSTTTTQNG